METKKKTHGGARAGSGRKSEDKTTKFLGYRYTAAESEAMKEALEKIKKATGKTTSRILFELLTNVK